MVQCPRDIYARANSYRERIKKNDVQPRRVVFWDALGRLVATSETADAHTQLTHTHTHTLSAITSPSWQFTHDAGR